MPVGLDQGKKYMSHHPGTPTKADLLVIGPALAGSGYPNARNTVRLLMTAHELELLDRACWLPGDFHLWKMARGNLQEKLRGLWLLGSRSLLSLYRLARHGWHCHCIYLPYPSLPLLWLLSWLPARLRPRCIADAYITLWDTLYQDRQLGKPQGVISRLLLRAETRALRAAHRIIVDTTANAEHVSQLFGVPRQRIAAFPLALAPDTLPAKAPEPVPGKPTRVLFIGTFVPLQGTEVIAQAIALLGERTDIEFVLIGDGQQADAVAPLLLQQTNVHWKRGWQPADVLASELARADICLGVFGGDGKAARVLPFKLYMALAAGKAIISQQHYSLPDNCPPLPILSCAAAPQALSKAIEQLAAAPAQREQLALQASDYFQQCLSPAQLILHWQMLLSPSVTG